MPHIRSRSSGPLTPNAASHTRVSRTCARSFLKFRKNPRSRAVGRTQRWECRPKHRGNIPGCPVRTQAGVKHYAMSFDVLTVSHLILWGGSRTLDHSSRFRQSWKRLASEFGESRAGVFAACTGDEETSIRQDKKNTRSPIGSRSVGVGSSGYATGMRFVPRPALHVRVRCLGRSAR